ncbi:hypothetical protein [Bradyrhizobium sp. CCH5-F6]|jgi:hypothetical protein|uniref:hypothetical protein n=1 Tax=Bradyrhizobium sp. CCH5-F6 TaxID=1768753 RepID=UPI000A6610B2|nr:hypothetical protein [Bradyrhizobium sp. CCH5-F6]
MLFQIGDYVAGAVIGMATALLVRLVIWPGTDIGGRNAARDGPWHDRLAAPELLARADAWYC